VGEGSISVLQNTLVLGTDGSIYYFSIASWSSSALPLPFLSLPQEWLLPIAGEDFALQEAVAARKAAAAAAKGGRGKTSSSSSAASSLLSGLTGNTSGGSRSNSGNSSGKSGSHYAPGQPAQRPQPAAVDPSLCANAALVAGELCAWVWKLALGNHPSNAAADGGSGGTLSPGGLPVGCGPAALAAVANGLHECGGRVYLMNHRYFGVDNVC